MTITDELLNIADDMFDLAALQPENWDTLLTRQANRLLDVIDTIIDKAKKNDSVGDKMKQERFCKAPILQVKFHRDFGKPLYNRLANASVYMATLLATRGSIFKGYLVHPRHIALLPDVCPQCA